jgi:sugar lactone lactonase YvrE
MTSLTSARVVTEGLVFPEGPRWHEGALWLSDMHARRVLRIDPSGGVQPHVVIENLGDKTSGLGFMPDGSLLVVSMVDRALMRVDTDTGAFSVHADMRPLLNEFANDLVVDSRGRAYVGGRNEGGGAAGPKDCIVLVEPDGSARIAADGLQGPNGMVIDDDETMLVVAETPLGRLTKFEIDVDGTLVRRSVFAQVEGAVFDGICLDAGGRVWTATGTGGACLLLRASGKVEDTIEADGEWVIACALGGAGRRELFILLTTTSPEYMKRAGINAELEAARQGRRIERVAEPSDACSARVVAVTVEVPGAGFP